MNGREENTVQAEGQMRNTNTLRYYGNPSAPKRILIVGNSITRHGPLASIGWNCDWGMAASAEEKDYVHLLLNKWRDCGEDVFLCVKQAADWEVAVNQGKPDLSEYRPLASFSADVVIFRLAENIGGGIDREYFGRCLREFLLAVAPPSAQILLTTSFWENEPVNAELRALASERGYALAELAPLGADRSMKAYGAFEHEGVCAHPSDRGMEAIAEAIFSAYLTLS